MCKFRTVANGQVGSQAERQGPWASCYSVFIFQVDVNSIHAFVARRIYVHHSSLLYVKSVGLRIPRSLPAVEYVNQ